MNVIWTGSRILIGEFAESPLPDELVEEELDARDLESSVSSQRPSYCQIRSNACREGSASIAIPLIDTKTELGFTPAQ